MKATHQKGTGSGVLPLSRRCRADRQCLGKQLNAEFATDMLCFKKKSLTGNVGCQIFSHESGFNAVHHIPQSNDEHVGNLLEDFTSDHGAPEHPTMDGASAQVGRHTTFQKLLRDHQIKSQVSSPHRPDQNQAEGAMREVERRWCRMQSKLSMPDRPTNFRIQCICETGNLAANGSRCAKGRTPLELMTGDTPDISEHLDFGFCNFVQH